MGMKTAVSIPDKLFAAAEREAKRRGVSRSKLVQTALEQLLKAKRDAGITARINRSLAEHPEPADPFMDRLAKQAMARAEWPDEAGRDLVGGRGRTKRARSRN